MKVLTTAFQNWRVIRPESGNMSKLTDAFERGEGFYTIAEVAFYAQMHPVTVRSWFRKKYPLFRSGTSSIDSCLLTFTDLIEALYVRKLRTEFKIGFPTIRTAIDTASRLKGVPHPFAHPDFRTVVVGKEINIIDRYSDDTDPAMVALAPNPGQISSSKILEQFIDDLEFDAGRKIIKHIAFRAARERVIIAPDFNFGEPMVESAGYPAETLWTACRAEGGVKQAADAYGVEEYTVQAAVDYYESILKSAGRG